MQAKVDFNIEYSHIAGTESISGGLIREEHIKSIEETKKIIKTLNSIGKTYSLCVLIDDYNETICF